MLLGETHARTESADSGLGMGSCNNLGVIPEDMNLETMDILLRLVNKYSEVRTHHLLLNL